MNLLVDLSSLHLHCTHMLLLRAHFILLETQIKNSGNRENAQIVMIYRYFVNRLEALAHWLFMSL